MSRSGAVPVFRVAAYSNASRLLWMLFLTGVFLVDHNWHFSQTFVGGYAGGYARPTVDELVQLVEKGNLARRLIILALGITALGSLYSGRNQLCASRIQGTGWLFLTLASWELVSVTWSLDPEVSLRRLVALAMLWLAAVAVSLRFRTRDIVLWVFFSSLCYLHIGVLAEVANRTFHPLAMDYRFAGTLHPGQQAINCALLLIAALFMAVYERRWRIIYALVACEAFTWLLLTKSRAGLGATLLAVGIAIAVRSSVTRRRLLALGVCIASCLFLLFADVNVPIIEQAMTLGRPDSDNSTLTGRVPLWQQAYSYVKARPLEGYGFGAFWTPTRIVEVAAEQHWTIDSAHSTYLDFCLEVGLTGCCLYLVLVTWSIRRAFSNAKQRGRHYDGFLGTVLLLALLVGVTQSIGVAINAATFLLMLTFISLGLVRPQTE